MYLKGSKITEEKKETLRFERDGVIWERVEEPEKVEVNDCGLTPKEEECHGKFMEAYGLFCKLEKQHPDEPQEMTTAIHAIQGILCMRAARRKFKGWATYRIVEKAK